MYLQTPSVSYFALIFFLRNGGDFNSKLETRFSTRLALLNAPHCEEKRWIETISRRRWINFISNGLEKYRCCCCCYENLSERNDNCWKNVSIKVHFSRYISYCFLENLENLIFNLIKTVNKS